MPPPLPFPVAEANRTDLNVPTPSPQPQGQPNGKPQAMQLPTGTGYGERQSLQAAQKAVPLPKAPAGPQPHMGAPMTHGEALAQAKQFPVLPGQLGAFTRPTERPNEPVTAGLPGNVPGGPMPQQVPSSNLATMLSRVAQAANSPALGELAQRAARLGQ